MTDTRQQQQPSSNGSSNVQQFQNVQSLKIFPKQLISDFEQAFESCVGILSGPQKNVHCHISDEARTSAEVCIQRLMDAATELDTAFINQSRKLVQLRPEEMVMGDNRDIHAELNRRRQLFVNLQDKVEQWAAILGDGPITAMTASGAHASTLSASANVSMGGGVVATSASSMNNAPAQVGAVASGSAGNVGGSAAYMNMSSSVHSPASQQQLPQTLPSHGSPMTASGNMLASSPMQAPSPANMHAMQSQQPSSLTPSQMSGQAQIGTQNQMGQVTMNAQVRMGGGFAGVQQQQQPTGMMNMCGPGIRPNATMSNEQQQHLMQQQRQQQQQMGMHPNQFMGGMQQGQQQSNRQRQSGNMQSPLAHLTAIADGNRR